MSLLEKAKNEKGKIKELERDNKRLIKEFNEAGHSYCELLLKWAEQKKQIEVLRVVNLDMHKEINRLNSERRENALLGQATMDECNNTIFSMQKQLEEKNLKLTNEILNSESLNRYWKRAESDLTRMREGVSKSVKELRKVDFFSSDIQTVRLELQALLSDSSKEQTIKIEKCCNECKTVIECGENNLCKNLKTVELNKEE